MHAPLPFPTPFQEQKGLFHTAPWNWVGFDYCFNEEWVSWDKGGEGTQKLDWDAFWRTLEQSLDSSILYRSTELSLGSNVCLLLGKGRGEIEESRRTPSSSPQYSTLFSRSSQILNFSEVMNVTPAMEHDRSE